MEVTQPTVVGPAKRLTPLPSLVVTGEGPLQGHSFSLDGDELVVGRREHSDVHMPDPHVSRTHAVIRKHSGAVWIEDLGSTGGTWVNDQQVAGARALRHGDQVRFGAVTTRFEDRTAAMEREDDTEMMEVAPNEVGPDLSPRQKEVLTYLRDGLTNPEIARRLDVTERTVKAHCQEVFDRLGTRNRTAAVAAALRLGLLSEDED
jgi:DNA-binding CsgD family transcriptional regulator